MGHFYKETMERMKIVSHTRTQAELAALLGIRQASISDAKRRQSIPAEWYLKLFEKLGVNPDWLKKGTGPIYLRTEAGYLPGNGKGTAIDPHLLGSPLAQPMLATVYAMRTTPGKGVASAPELQPLGKLSVPKPYARKGIIILAVDNDAAAPTVRRGAHVGIDTAAGHPASGELFAVSLPCAGIVLRRLFLDQKEDCLVLRAENPAYPDIRVRASLKETILGRLAWVMQEV